MKKNLSKKEKLFCRDCENSYNFHEIGANGKPFMCRCKIDKYLKMLNHDFCENFKKISK